MIVARPVDAGSRRPSPPRRRPCRPTPRPCAGLRRSRRSQRRRRPRRRPPPRRRSRVQPLPRGARPPSSTPPLAAGAGHNVDVFEELARLPEPLPLGDPAGPVPDLLAPPTGTFADDPFAVSPFVGRRVAVTARRARWSWSTATPARSPAADRVRPRGRRPADRRRHAPGLRPLGPRRGPARRPATRRARRRRGRRPAGSLRTPPGAETGATGRVLGGHRRLDAHRGRPRESRGARRRRAQRSTETEIVAETVESPAQTPWASDWEPDTMAPRRSPSRPAPTPTRGPPTSGRASSPATTARGSTSPTPRP